MVIKNGMTVICRIPNVFVKKRVIGNSIRRPDLLIIWHVDPQIFGVRDSCKQAYGYYHSIEEYKGPISEVTLDLLQYRDRLLSESRWINKVIPLWFHFWHYRISLGG